MTESLQRKRKLLCVHCDALSKNPHCGLRQLRARAQHEVITFFATLVCPTPIKKSKVQHTVAVLKELYVRLWPKLVLQSVSNYC